MQTILRLLQILQERGTKMNAEEYIVGRCLELENANSRLSAKKLMLEKELSDTKRDCAELSDLLLKFAKHTTVFETTTDGTKDKGLLISHFSAVWEDQNPELYAAVSAFAEKYGILKKKGGEE